MQIYSEIDFEYRFLSLQCVVSGGLHQWSEWNRRNRVYSIDFQTVESTVIVNLTPLSFNSNSTKKQGVRL